ncbi:hypothetical protein WJX84_002021 [Apatococcus fuscideae]|uniref:F-box domain-containing protein n=1 Tax=Apatococcus fuscideae TaxID=2026836 RepID=A0AAW1T177_9CHLO
MNRSTLSLLPEEVLLQVLSLVPFNERRTSIPLVCKQFRGLARGSSTLWSNCTICARPCKSYFRVMRWLSNHGSAVKDLDLIIFEDAGPQQAWARGAVGLLALTPNLQKLSINDGSQDVLFFRAEASVKLAAAEVI